MDISDANSDGFFMRVAIKEAIKAADEDEVPIGAVIVIDNKVIAKTHNQVERLNDSTAHAEIIALTSAFNNLGSKYLPDATIYITIEPCLMCAGALYWSKIGKVVYGATDAKNGYRRHCNHEGGHPFHPKTTLITGVHAEECSNLIKDFFKSKR